MNILKINVLYNIGFYKFPTSKLKQYHVWPNQILHETDNYTDLCLKIKSLKKCWNLMMINRKKYFQQSMEPGNYFLEQEEKCY